MDYLALPGSSAALQQVRRLSIKADEAAVVLEAATSGKKAAAAAAATDRKLYLRESLASHSLSFPSMNWLLVTCSVSRLVAEPLVVAV